MGILFSARDDPSSPAEFRRDIIQDIRIEEDRFGFEPEITTKIAALHWRVFEVGISYAGQTYGDGKKIGWRDGVWAILCVLKHNLRANLAPRSSIAPAPSRPSPPVETVAVPAGRSMAHTRAR
jgi:hypothetical protein